MLFYGWREGRTGSWLVLVRMLVLGFGKSNFLGNLELWVKRRERIIEKVYLVY